MTMVTGKESKAHHERDTFVPHMFVCDLLGPFDLGLLGKNGNSEIPIVKSTHSHDPSSAQREGLGYSF